ncbi:MAG: hypothetical protein ACK4V6_03370 [Microthrixaceae bacterium]
MNVVDSGDSGYARAPRAALDRFIADAWVLTDDHAPVDQLLFR